MFETAYWKYSYTHAWYFAFVLTNITAVDDALLLRAYRDQVSQLCVSVWQDCIHNKCVVSNMATPNMVRSLLYALVDIWNSPQCCHIYLKSYRGITCGNHMWESHMIFPISVRAPFYKMKFIFFFFGKFKLFFFVHIDYLFLHTHTHTLAHFTMSYFPLLPRNLSINFLCTLSINSNFVQLWLNLDIIYQSNKNPE